MSLSKLEATPLEVRFAILSLLSVKDAIALARTNKDIKSWALPEVYRIHAEEAKEDATVVPLALQWAVWSGEKYVFEAMIQAMDMIDGLDSNEVVTRTISEDTELAGFLVKRGREPLPHTGNMSRRGEYGRPYSLPNLQLLDLASITGHLDLVKVLADKAGDISQEPRDGFMSHVAYANDVEMAKFLISRGASMGTTENSCVFLGLACRAAWAQRNDTWSSSPFKNGVKRGNVLGVLNYLRKSGYKVSQRYTRTIWLHPLVQAILSSVPTAITILFKAAGTFTLTGPQSSTMNLVSKALGLFLWKSASVLLDAGAIPDGAEFAHVWNLGQCETIDTPVVKKVIQKMLQVMPKDTTVYRELLTVRAMRDNNFELLEALVKAGFARPNKRIELGERRMERLMQFLERR
ncbi:hypothetical protein E8E14_005512 [Neopestalotiopsis sp. 37M]|nr:hypothetical protein E8E14_005512 [Neopestalotiopsis sp. 37M]